MSDQNKFLLDEQEIPKHWYNIQADLPTPAPPPLHPGTLEPIGPARLRALRDEHGGPEILPELSMGMSEDFETAIRHGATLVRVGTALFGERPPRSQAE